MEIHFNYTTYPLKISTKKEDVFGDLEPYITYTFSGKSALAHALNYLKKVGTLKDKSDEILVPPWLGSWVYMTMHHDSFPSLSIHEGLRGVMVYHQWGFPQKMKEIKRFCEKRKLFCIEDCAHAFSSTYRGQRVGTFGDVSIWSLSKFFPSVVGGALYSCDMNTHQFVRMLQKKADTQLEKEAFDQRHRYDKKPDRQHSIELEKHYAVYPRLVRCPRYSLNVVAHELNTGALQKRKENFELLRTTFWGKNEESLVEDGEVAPWVVPLFFGSKNAAVAKALTDRGIESGVYHFDVNRTILDPDFKTCVPVPCHQAITGRQMSTMIDTIRAAV